MELVAIMLLIVIGAPLAIAWADRAAGADQ